MSDLQVGEKQTEKITIKIRDTEGNESQFRMRYNAPLQKLMDAYCQHMATPTSTYRFLFDGRRVQRKDTAKSLDLQDLDTIDALIHQTGGRNIERVESRANVE